MKVTSKNTLTQLPYTGVLNRCVFQTSKADWSIVLLEPDEYSLERIGPDRQEKVEYRSGRLFIESLQ